MGLALKTPTIMMQQSKKTEVIFKTDTFLNLSLFALLLLFLQRILHLNMLQHLVPAETGVLSWLRWNHQTVVVTIFVRPTIAVALTLTVSASRQVMNDSCHFLPKCISSRLNIDMAFDPFFKKLSC